MAHCLNLGFNIRGTTIVDPSTTSVIAWIKYGPNVTIDEARTQDWAAKALRDAGSSDVLDWLHRHGVRRGYRCDSNDVELVAKAVQALIGLQAPPGATLGHIGGGTRSIVHSFFPEWLPNVDYKSDQDFYAHIHKVFEFLCIDFGGDISSHGRFLCPSDFNPSNFRKRNTTQDGRLAMVAVVLDFRATCFMPLPFIEVALKKPRDCFSQSVVKKIMSTYPHQHSNDAEILLSASGSLVQYGSKPVALPLGVSPRMNGI